MRFRSVSIILRKLSLSLYIYIYICIYVCIYIYIIYYEPWNLKLSSLYFSRAPAAQRAIVVDPLAELAVECAVVGGVGILGDRAKVLEGLVFLV